MNKTKIEEFNRKFQGSIQSVQQRFHESVSHVISFESTDQQNTFLEQISFIGDENFSGKSFSENLIYFEHLYPSGIMVIIGGQPTHDQNYTILKTCIKMGLTRESIVVSEKERDVYWNYIHAICKLTEEGLNITDTAPSNSKVNKQFEDLKKKVKNIKGQIIGGLFCIITTFLLSLLYYHVFFRSLINSADHEFFTWLILWALVLISFIGYLFSVYYFLALPFNIVRLPIIKRKLTNFIKFHEIEISRPVDSIEGNLDKISEQDNKGTRLDSIAKAETCFVKRNSPYKTNFVVYRFKRLNDAYKALLHISYIFFSIDSQNLITNMDIGYGYYERDGNVEVMICGAALTDEMWNEANNKLKIGGGVLYSALKPIESTEDVHRGQRIPELDRINQLCNAAFDNNINEVKKLLAEGADVNTCNADGNTPLHFATEANSIDVMRFLIDNHAFLNVQNKNLLTPMHFAAIKNRYQAAKLLFENKVLMEIQDDVGDSPLHCCAIYNSVDVAKLLLENRVNINIKNNKGDTPLHCAGQRDQKKIGEFLIGHGASREEKNNKGEVPDTFWRPPNWPKYEHPIKIPMNTPFSHVRINNPNNDKVRVGLRSGNVGGDYIFMANESANIDAYTNSHYKIYFQYEWDPESIYEGTEFDLVGQGISITLCKVPQGNYHIRKIQ